MEHSSKWINKVAENCDDYVRSLKKSFFKRFRRGIPGITGYIQPDVFVGDRVVSRDTKIPMERISKEKFKSLLSNTLSEKELEEAWIEWPYKERK